MVAKGRHFSNPDKLYFTMAHTDARWRAVGGCRYRSGTIADYVEFLNDRFAAVHGGGQEPAGRAIPKYATIDDADATYMKRLPQRNVLGDAERFAREVSPAFLEFWNRIEAAYREHKAAIDEAIGGRALARLRKTNAAVRPTSYDASPALPVARAAAVRDMAERDKLRLAKTIMKSMEPTTRRLFAQYVIFDEASEPLTAADDASAADP